MRFPLGIHIPVDDLREWVVSGIRHALSSGGWTEETNAQYQLAERAALGIAKRYHEAGFAVCVDHCRRYASWESAIQEVLPDVPIIRIALTPSLESNLERNLMRTNKEFDTNLLTPLTTDLNRYFLEERPTQWIGIDSTTLTLEETVDRIVGSVP